MCCKFMCLFVFVCICLLVCVFVFVLACFFVCVCMFACALFDAHVHTDIPWKKIELFPKNREN